VEFLGELETKIDSILSSVKSLKEENSKLSEENLVQAQKITEIEANNQALKTELESLQQSINEKQNKLDSASEKVQSLLSKLESAA
jgi:chromosome segregation ATPase